jgi:hypothetical protein
MKGNIPMFNLEKVLPTKRIHPVDLVNRSEILETKLLYTNMTPQEVDEAEHEIEEISRVLDSVPA